MWKHGTLIMFTRLAHEIDQLILESRDVRIYDPAVIKELTMIAGYAHILGRDCPTSSENAAVLRKHVQALSTLVGRHEHPDLYAHSERILTLLDREATLHDVA